MADMVPIAAEQLHQLPQEPSSEWVVSIKEKLKEAQQYAARKPWEKWCIYQVPRCLRDVQENKKTYVPQTVSIGPHHLGSEQVQDMDIHKWIALHQILQRTGKDLNLYLNSIKQVEEQARACYQQEFEHLSSNKFVEMMVLDGCFILELFRCYPREKETGNPVFSNQRIINEILLDMVMLENQIPLFVIDRLLNTSGEHPKDPIALVLNLFNPEWLTGLPISIKEFEELISSLHQEKCLHILDVFRRSLLYVGRQQSAIHKPRFQRRVYDKLVPGCLKQWLQRNRAPDRKSMCIHRASDLTEGGIKFRKRNANCFWDIRFSNGDLEIPTIEIKDSTKIILLNVAAFEHCHLKISDAVIASYVVFMECLIKSPEDVSHLHHCEIIQHLLGDDAEVVDMFKSISKEILVDSHDGYYAELSGQVNKYYNQRRNIWRAILLHKYLNNPWAIISLIAASILLILTTLQSFYAMYSYHRPNS